MVMVEITENKLNELFEHTEQILRHSGKAMQCLDSLRHGRGEMNHRYEDEERRRREMDRGGMERSWEDMQYRNRGGYGNQGGGYGNRGYIQEYDPYYYM